jgi:hypothetical protein
VSLNNAVLGIVLEINGSTVTLSRTVPGSGKNKYTFKPPTMTPIAGLNDTTWKYLQPFTPTGTVAMEFAQTVYTVMNALSSTVPGGLTHPSVQLLGNIIGATVSKMPSINTTIQTIVTDQIKSLLRGVPDYTNSKYADPSQWYPDPAVATTGSG